MRRVRFRRRWGGRPCPPRSVGPPFARFALSNSSFSSRCRLPRRWLRNARAQKREWVFFGREGPPLTLAEPPPSTPPTYLPTHRTHSPDMHDEHERAEHSLNMGSRRVQHRALSGGFPSLHLEPNNPLHRIPPERAERSSRSHLVGANGRSHHPRIAPHHPRPPQQQVSSDRGEAPCRHLTPFASWPPATGWASRYHPRSRPPTAWAHAG